MSETEVSIVQAQDSERAALEQILEESFTGIYLRHAKRTLSDVETVRVIRVGGTAVGLAMLKLIAKQAGYVYYVAIVPSWRRKGLATRLLLDSLDHFRQLGTTEVYASVGEDNDESKALFLGRGFRRTDFGEVSKKYGAIRALAMYRGMWVVPGEMVLVRDSATLLEAEPPGS
jgi:ribosomal protein S18 acetylase RimI-like enzyme